MMSRHGKNCAYKVEAATDEQIESWREGCGPDFPADGWGDKAVLSLIARIDAQAEQIVGFQAAHETMTALLGSLSAQDEVIAGVLSDHSAIITGLRDTITRLQTANTREVERRREAEQRADHREGLAVYGFAPCRTCEPGRITLYARPPYVCIRCANKEALK